VPGKTSLKEKLGNLLKRQTATAAFPSLGATVATGSPWCRYTGTSTLPPINTPQDAAATISAVLAAVAIGAAIKQPSAQHGPEDMIPKRCADAVVAGRKSMVALVMC
jgi:hypothetical protein